MRSLTFTVIFVLLYRDPLPALVYVNEQIQTIIIGEHFVLLTSINTLLSALTSLHYFSDEPDQDYANVFTSLSIKDGTFGRSSHRNSSVQF